MKKNRRRTADDMRPEYDFATMKGGIRGKYVRRYRAGTNIVLLEPDLAQAFPGDAAVNHALRAVLSATKVVRQAPRPSNRRLQPTAGRRKRHGKASEDRPGRG